MTIERLHNGAWQIYASDKTEHLFTRTFFGYTKREAIAEFRRALKERNKSYV